MQAQRASCLRARADRFPLPAGRPMEGGAAPLQPPRAPLQARPIVEEALRHAEMLAVPELDTSQGERMTAVVCPSCPGVLAVVGAVGGKPMFRCRVGHMFGADQLLEMKELRLEDHLWAMVTACEEFAALLRDLHAFPERQRALLEQAREVRSLIERAEPIQWPADADAASCSAGDGLEKT